MPSPRAPWHRLAAPCWRGVAMVLLPLLGGCAGAGGAGGNAGPAAMVEETEPVASAAQPFDGWYQGRQILTPESVNCGGTGRALWFRVRGGTIQAAASRHRKSAARKPLLEGRVTQNGTLLLYAPERDRSASGMIRGDELAALDMPEAPGMPTRRRSCSYRYEATRKPQR